MDSAMDQARLPRQLSDRGTEVPHGLISYGRWNRSPSCRAGCRSAGAPRSGRREEEEARLRQPSATYSSHPAKVDAAAVGAERCSHEALPPGDRVAAQQLHLRSRRSIGFDGSKLASGLSSSDDFWEVTPSGIEFSPCKFSKQRQGRMRIAAGWEGSSGRAWARTGQRWRRGSGPGRREAGPPGGEEASLDRLNCRRC
ncbi:uncharacterized protein LOC120639988 [Panicum virgatum]|uniref:uncharacterized protein LOC120639988 n=1 Tax=Panicum virgatum TaxID=38727 RepID=UPI0019D5F296|nr:uncharacterized protein LOC120639988 [Panicum virgatum]